MPYKAVSILMVITDNFADSPNTLIITPNHEKFECPTIIFTIFPVAECVFADMYSAVTFDGVYFKAAFDEVSPNRGI